MGGRDVCLKKDDDVGCLAVRASGGCYAYFVGRDDIGYLAGMDFRAALRRCPNNSDYWLPRGVRLQVADRPGREQILLLT